MKGLTFGAMTGYFLWSLLLGCGLALVYDFFRAKRRMTNISVVRINLEDICFFILAGALVFWIAYDKNGGRLRWQGFLGTFLGFWLYRRILKDAVVRALVIIQETLIKVFLYFIRIISFPVRAVYKILAKPFLVIAWYSKAKIKKVNGIFLARCKKSEMRKRCRQAEKKRGKARKKMQEKMENG